MSSVRVARAITSAPAIASGSGWVTRDASVTAVSIASRSFEYATASGAIRIAAPLPALAADLDAGAADEITRRTKPDQQRHQPEVHRHMLQQVSERRDWSPSRKWSMLWRMTVEILRVVQPVVHYGLHLLAPGLIAWLFFRDQWKRAWLLMLATMLVDLDHLFAYPDVFVPDRCGIGFHPLHTIWAMSVYAVLLLVKRVRIIAVGLLFHMFTDLQDCLWIAYLTQ